jgi:hypothetical protein
VLDPHEPRKQLDHVPVHLRRVGAEVLKQVNVAGVCRKFKDIDRGVDTKFHKDKRCARMSAFEWCNFFRRVRN